MKKILSIALVLTLILALGCTAYAVEAPETSVTKTYVLGDGTAAPVEDLSFEVEFISGVTGGYEGELTIGDANVFTTDGTDEMAIALNFPTFSKVGVYKWTITETAGSTQGVTYDEEPITVVVTITNKEGSTEDATTDDLEATVAIHKSDADATSQDNKLGEGDSAFENTYGQGQLTITKQVTGNLASNEKLFTIHVTFTAESEVGSDITYTVAGGEEQTLSFDGTEATTDIQLSSTQSATFTNIPAGVSYVVEEDASHLEGADSPETTEEGYSVEYDGNEAGDIEADDDITTVITNTKETEVDTGISLDSLPYVLIVAVILAASVVMVVSKRRSEV